MARRAGGGSRSEPELDGPAADARAAPLSAPIATSRAPNAVSPTATTRVRPSQRRIATERVGVAERTRPTASMAGTEDTDGGDSSPVPGQGRRAARLRRREPSRPRAGRRGWRGGASRGTVAGSVSWLSTTAVAVLDCRACGCCPAGAGRVVGGRAASCASTGSDVDPAPADRRRGARPVAARSAARAAGLEAAGRGRRAGADRPAGVAPPGSLWRALRWLSDRLLWRIRTKLILSYLFIALVPVLLMTAFSTIAVVLLLGLVGSRIVTGEIDRAGDLPGPRARRSWTCPRRTRRPRALPARLAAIRDLHPGLAYALVRARKGGRGGRPRRARSRDG